MTGTLGEIRLALLSRALPAQAPRARFWAPTDFGRAEARALLLRQRSRTSGIRLRVVK